MEQTQTASPDGIPAGAHVFNESIETIKGKIIRLNAGVFWKSANGEVELNAFTGAITAVVPKGISATDAYDVLKGLRLNTIAFADREETAVPGVRNVADLIPNRVLVEATMLLDETDMEKFITQVNKTFRLDVLERAQDIERNSTNRATYIKVIDARVVALRTAGA